MALDGQTLAKVNTIRKTSKAVKLPAAVTAALKDLEAVAANRATIDAEANDARAAAHTAALNGKLTLDVAAKASTAGAAGPILDAAEMEAANNLFAVNQHHADTIIKSIRETLFNPALEALEDAAARTSQGDTAESLIRAGRDADAKALVAAGGTYQELHSARAHYGNYITRDNRGHRNLSWHNPEDIAWELKNVQGQPNEAYRFIDALRAGGQAWMPTNAELSQITAQDQAEREAAQANTNGHTSRMLIH